MEIFRKRLFFYMVNLLFLMLIILVSIVIYHVKFSLSFDMNLSILYDFIGGRQNNILFIIFSIFLLTYLSGLVSFSTEDKSFNFLKFLNLMFRFFLILGIVSFIEFYLFFHTKIGRLIYLYIFLIYSLYYYIFLKHFNQKFFNIIIWKSKISFREFLSEYIKYPKRYIFNEYKKNRNGQHSNDIVYSRNSLSDRASESLIEHKLNGNKIIELVDFIENESGRIPLKYVDNHWLLEKLNFLNQNYQRINNFLNRIIAFCLIFVLFPLGLLLGLLNILFSKGPLFYKQKRLGRYSRHFTLLKFRTMVDNAETNGPQFTQKNDSRITFIGSIMRKTRLDEVPQLINVLRGELNLVGPRPERECFVKKLEGEIPYYKLRLLVKPGLTGWAQVNGLYARDNVDEHRVKLEYDLYYVKNRSIFLDLLILIKTIKTVFMGIGE